MTMKCVADEVAITSVKILHFCNRHTDNRTPVKITVTL